MPRTQAPIPTVRRRACSGTVSPLDPQLFYRIDDFADDLLKGERSGKYTPIEVAQWIEDYAAAATASLARGEASRDGKGPARVPTTDHRHRRGRRISAASSAPSSAPESCTTSSTGPAIALRWKQALKAYRAAREAWAGIAARTKGVYMADITVGEMRAVARPLGRPPGGYRHRYRRRRGEAGLRQARAGRRRAPIARAIAEALGRPQRPAVAGRHTPPARFEPGRALAVEFAAEKDYASVRLHYRHVNQAERWQSEPMQSDGRLWRAAIPSEYTESPTRFSTTSK